ncbi:MAG: glycosyltransferase [Candidatus Daviesbacteria bacterium]|nr:glycosyltransferase [Candidatus Daviesbacteria bacterium]
MKNKPLVSVVMPVFNADRYIHKAIESILNQTLKNFEFIIINDASVDKTLQIIYEFKKKDKRIRLINNKKNLQMAQSLNLGVNEAKSGLIARMDQDDISLPDRLKIQYDFMQSNPSVAIVGNDIIIIDEDDKITGKRTYPTISNELKKILFRYSAFAHPTVMFRKSAFKEVGGYNVEKYPCEDIDLWFRLGKKFEFASIPSFLFKYRVSLNSGSHQNLTKTEILGLKIKIQAIKRYNCRPTLYDIIYIFFQFATLWFMPFNTRIRLYNILRGNNLI